MCVLQGGGGGAKWAYVSGHTQHGKRFCHQTSCLSAIYNPCVPNPPNPNPKLSPSHPHPHTLTLTPSPSHPHPHTLTLTLTPNQLSRQQTRNKTNAGHRRPFLTTRTNSGVKGFDLRRICLLSLTGLLLHLYFHVLWTTTKAAL